MLVLLVLLLLVLVLVLVLLLLLLLAARVISQRHRTGRASPAAAQTVTAAVQPTARGEALDSCHGMVRLAVVSAGLGVV
ncbi:MAG: hypothetical protein C1943_06830 [Halochromatium sp.]|nr:hypothetical protein [Halochromatium sp.]